jgi:hypothetical protein
VDRRVGEGATFCVEHDPAELRAVSDDELERLRGLVGHVALEIGSRAGMVSAGRDDHRTHETRVHVAGVLRQLAEESSLLVGSELERAGIPMRPEREPERRVRDPTTVAADHTTVQDRGPLRN